MMQEGFDLTLWPHVTGVSLTPRGMLCGTTCPYTDARIRKWKLLDATVAVNFKMKLLIA